MKRRLQCWLLLSVIGFAILSGCGRSWESTAPEGEGLKGMDNFQPVVPGPGPDGTTPTPDPPPASGGA
jgi:hypothetical protein